MTKDLGDERIFHSDSPCCQPEHHTSIRAYDILHILVATADIPEVPASFNGFNQRIGHHHCLRADSIPILIHRTAICAGIFIANFFPITVETFWLISSQIPCNLNSNSYSSSSHFFRTQSYHTQSSFLHSSPPFASLRRWRLLEIKVEPESALLESSHLHIPLEPVFRVL